MTTELGINCREMTTVYSYNRWKLECGTNATPLITVDSELTISTSPETGRPAAGQSCASEMRKRRGGPSIDTEDKRVAAYWSPESGTLLAVDGYSEDCTGCDLASASARQLVADLAAVLDKLDG